MFYSEHAHVFYFSFLFFLVFYIECLRIYKHHCSAHREPNYRTVIMIERKSQSSCEVMTTKHSDICVDVGNIFSVAVTVEAAQGSKWVNCQTEVGGQTGTWRSRKSRATELQLVSREGSCYWTLGIW